MLDDQYYRHESILIHEFAHSVMCIGSDNEQRESICNAYNEAKQGGLYQEDIYMMENADEYWAEATQSWFDATVRTGMQHRHLFCKLILLQSNIDILHPALFGQNCIEPLLSMLVLH